MATVDLSKAKASVHMDETNLVGFASIQGASPAAFSYLTPAGHKVLVSATDLDFDSAGIPISGTATSIGIDLGNNASLDILISGVAADVATLAGGPESFWRFLEGDDVIVGGLKSQVGGAASFTIFGDGPAARTGGSVGGNDSIDAGDTFCSVSGDVRQTGGVATGAAATLYHGGNDTIMGRATDYKQTLSGDAWAVGANCRLTGGGDTIFIQSGRHESAAVGDAAYVEGMAGSLAVVIGGNDIISAGPNSNADLIGDIQSMYEHSVVRGGNDTLKGADRGEYIVGDVYQAHGDRAVGGADILYGNGGTDWLFGDFLYRGDATRAIGGNDTIFGGDGTDFIYGETYGEDFTGLSGGHDQLHGEDGVDYLYGQTGNDTLDGGAGDDFLYGGTGRDTYVIDSESDQAIENAGEGIDTILLKYAYLLMPDHIENLTFIGSGDLYCVGNNLRNTILGRGGNDFIAGEGGNDRVRGLNGNDILYGDDGNDTLEGGLGDDALDGGAGLDLASYVAAGNGVTASLDGSVAATGEAAGDSYVSIEGLQGSNFADRLIGDANANRLLGEVGNDVLAGGAGADTLTGGVGNDRFEFRQLGGGRDRITDFSNVAGNNDRFDFDHKAFGGLPFGALASKHFLASADGKATTADHRFLYETDTGILRYDANGATAGGVTVIAVLDGAPLLTASDFFIV